MFLGQYKLFFIAIFHTKMFTSPSPETQNKAPKNLPRHRSQNKKKEKRKEKAANLQREYSTDQLPNHNSKTMSNKKLSKSNFHRHPLFSRSHLSPFGTSDVCSTSCIQAKDSGKSFIEKNQHVHRRSGLIMEYFILEN